MIGSVTSLTDIHLRKIIQQVYLAAMRSDLQVRRAMESTTRCLGLCVLFVVMGIQHTIHEALTIRSLSRISLASAG